MKVIIAGSRNITDYNAVCDAMVLSEFNVSEIVSGCARGVDRLGEQWASERLYPIKRFPADWTRGLSAGPTRNRAMAEYADCAVVVWDGVSRGSANMISIMKKLGKPVYIHHVPHQSVRD